MCFPASSTHTCTSTTPDGRTGRVSARERAALAAGGGTCFFDMPLNAYPPTVDGASFDLKLEAARAAAHVDFCLWGGLVPGDVDRLDELAERGVVGFKAFMCATGWTTFRRSTTSRCSRAWSAPRASGFRSPCTPRAQPLTARLSASALSEGRTSMRDYLRSRPVERRARGDRAGDRARRRDGLLASHRARQQRNGSAARGGSSCRRRRRDLRDVSALPRARRDDAEQLGMVAKCSPPLRPADRPRRSLDRRRRRGRHLIASDHSPSPPELKTGDDAFAVWGGIAGCQTLRRILLTEDPAVG